MAGSGLQSDYKVSEPDPSAPIKAQDLDKHGEQVNLARAVQLTQQFLGCRMEIPSWNLFGFLLKHQKGLLVVHVVLWMLILWICLWDDFLDSWSVLLPDVLTQGSINQSPIFLKSQDVGIFAQLIS